MAGETFFKSVRSRLGWARAISAIVVLGIVLVAAGCGGSSGDSTGSDAATDGQSEALSKAEWIEQADEICTKEKEEREPIEAEFEAEREEPETDAQLKRLADLTRELLARVEEETTTMRALQPPAGDEDTIDALLSEAQAAVPLGEQFADAIETGDSEAISAAAEQLEESSERTDRLAKDYGLKVCGSDE